MFDVSLGGPSAQPSPLVLLRSTREEGDFAVSCVDGPPNVRTLFFPCSDAARRGLASRKASAYSQSMHSFHIARRAFIRSCAVVAAATPLPRWFEAESHAASPDAPKPGPNDRPGIALIGCGGMG